MHPRLLDRAGRWDSCSECGGGEGRRRKKKEGAGGVCGIDDRRHEKGVAG
jgi:hypothetical protein